MQHAILGILEGDDGQVGAVECKRCVEQRDGFALGAEQLPGGAVECGIAHDVGCTRAVDILDVADVRAVGGVDGDRREHAGGRRAVDGLGRPGGAVPEGVAQVVVGVVKVAHVQPAQGVERSGCVRTDIAGSVDGGDLPGAALADGDLEIGVPGVVVCDGDRVAVDGHGGVGADAGRRVYGLALPAGAQVEHMIESVTAVGQMRMIGAVQAEAAVGHVLEVAGAVDALDAPARREIRRGGRRHAGRGEHRRKEHGPEHNKAGDPEKLMRTWLALHGESPFAGGHRGQGPEGAGRGVGSPRPARYNCVRCAGKAARRDR